jgi:putative hydrolase of the HAD superfamily
VGLRKPEPEIYGLTVERLGRGIGFADCLLVDDLEDNIAGARDLGMAAVHFQSNAQAIAAIEEALGSG